jgi:hypothetical protein
MDAILRGQVEDEVDRLGIIVKAAESWAKGYRKDPKSHAQIIKNEVRFERALRDFFFKVAKSVPSHINWSKYDKLVAEVKASRLDAADFNVTTLVTGDLFESENNNFMKVAFDYISTGTTIGAQSGQRIYNINLGLTSTSEIIQNLTTERIAWLVGKRVDKSGNVVDNPNADYRISDKTRDQIASSIQESIAHGENKKEATARLVEIVGDPARAEKIAQTESVNAFGSGLHNFGKESGATRKEWQDVGATDECKDNADAGVIPIDEAFPSGDMHPAAHTGCRCYERLDYSKEAE